MVRGKTDLNPIILKIGLALAVSIGGMIFSFIRNKRIKPAQSPSDSSQSSDCNNQEISGKESNIKPNSRQFDPLATDKHELRNSNTDKDSYLLPEFNDLIKDFDTNSIKVNPRVVKDTHEQEIKNLKNIVKTLKERERNLEIQLLEYYGLKEQETAVMELQNRLKLNNMEAKLFALKIESLQSDNKRLEAKMADYSKVLADLEGAKAKIKILKKKLRLEGEQNKEKIMELQKRVEKMQEDEDKGILGIDPEIELKIRKLKDLELEKEELRKSNHNIEVEKSELIERLERVQILATSVLEDKESEKLREESQQLKKQNEDLTKELEQLQADRCHDVEELVYLKWINACLRHELRNHKPGPGETTARDLSKSLSPKSEQKAKQLILEYANKESGHEKGVNFQDFDSDQWSSSHSQTSDNESFIEHNNNNNNLTPRSKSNNKFFGKLMKIISRKDNNTPKHSHSRNSSFDDVNSYNSSSFGKNSMESQRLMVGHRRIDSIAEGGDSGDSSGGGGGGGWDSPCSSNSRSSVLVKYAEVFKDSNMKSNEKFNLKSNEKFRRRSVSFSFS